MWSAVTAAAAAAATLDGRGADGAAPGPPASSAAADAIAVGTGEGGRGTGGSGGVGAVGAAGPRLALPALLMPGVGALLSVFIVLKGARSAYCGTDQKVGQNIGTAAGHTAGSASLSCRRRNLITRHACAHGLA